MCKRYVQRIAFILGFIIKSVILFLVENATVIYSIIIDCVAFL